MAMKQNIVPAVFPVILILVLLISSLTPSVFGFPHMFLNNISPTKAHSSAVETYITEDDTTIKIGNGFLEIGFNKTNGGGLDSILDKQTGLDLRSNKNGPPILFLVYFFNGTAVEGALQWNALGVDYAKETTPQYSTITIIHTNLKGYDLQATTTITLI